MSIVLCTWGSFIEGGTEEALTLARKLAASVGAELHWAVLGAAATEAPAPAERHAVPSLDVIRMPWWKRWFSIVASSSRPPSFSTRRSRRA